LRQRVMQLYSMNKLTYQNYWPNANFTAKVPNFQVTSCNHH
jgi:hypothetical protein